MQDFKILLILIATLVAPLIKRDVFIIGIIITFLSLLLSGCSAVIPTIIMGEVIQWNGKHQNITTFVLVSKSPCILIINN